jgi:hypothetical protein
MAVETRSHAVSPEFMSATLPIVKFQEKSLLRPQERICPAEIPAKPRRAREYTRQKQTSPTREVNAVMARKPGAAGSVGRYSTAKTSHRI